MRKGLLAFGLLLVGLFAVVPAAPAAVRCDPLDPSACLLPWPNDYFREGGRLALRDSLMPRNSAGKPITARDYNHSDGFSPGQTIVTRVPGLDNLTAFRRTGAVPVTDLDRYRARRQPVVVINARTRKRHLIWAEIDSGAGSRRRTTLLIHPAVNFREGERYIVALRRLRNSGGRILGARRSFRVYRDRIPTRSRTVERRRAHMESLFRTLGRARIARRGLYLAWDFTVASRRSLSQRLLFMRDRAFAELGDTNLRDLAVQGRPPPFSIDEVTTLAPCGSDGCQTGESDEIARRVVGRVTVPCFLNQPGCPVGSRFRLNRRGLPVRSAGNTIAARFVCVVPRSVGAGAPGRPLLLGHGLFGTGDVVDSVGFRRFASSERTVQCGADWLGMSSEDLANALALSADLSRFPTLVDRLQQGILDFMYLGRAMIHPQGLSSHPAFQDSGAPLIDTRRLFYSGISLGGIIGGAYTAVAPDSTRSVLIVPAMNFSVLISRSIQFTPFEAVLAPNYPNGLQRALGQSMLQVLWDRGEANGYAQHMTRDPYPNTPLHTVLLHAGFGDHQVANVQTEVEARTIGARLRTPALDPGRSRDRRPFYGIRPLPRVPYGGNALVVWDIGPLRAGGLGTPPPPTANVEPNAGADPHTLTPGEPAAQRQYGAFLGLQGAFIDTCGGRPCYAAGWTGP